VHVPRHESSEIPDLRHRGASILESMLTTESKDALYVSVRKINTGDGNGGEGGGGGGGVGGSSSRYDTENQKGGHPHVRRGFSGKL